MGYCGSYVADSVQSYEVVYVLMILLWAKLTRGTHQLIHNINVIVIKEMSFSCTKCDYCYSEYSTSEKTFSSTKCDFLSCINNVKSKRGVITAKVYFHVFNSSTCDHLNIQGKILHCYICPYLYNIYMSHMIWLLYYEYDYIPGILIQESQYNSITNLTVIIICDKMNAKWENGHWIIYNLQWRYKIT